jgi:threonine aldolase
VKETLAVETNIVFAILNDNKQRDSIIAKLAEHGIKCMAFGPGMLRFVSHLDVSASDIDKTCEAIRKVKI